MFTQVNSYYAASFKTGSESDFISDISVLEFKADKEKRINASNDNMDLNLTERKIILNRLLLNRL